MARRFTGTDRVVVGTRSIPTAAGTLALWWWPEFAQTDGVIHNAFWVENSVGNSFQLTKHASGFSNRLSAGWISGGGDYRVTVLPANYTLVQSAWNVFILTWDAAGSYLYLNGALIGSAGPPGTITTTAARCIGNHTAGNQPASGRIAEVVICSRAWSARERAAYEAGCPPLRLGPVDGYWPLWGADAAEQDLSPYGNTGIVTGATRANHAPVLPFSRKWWGSQLVEGAAPPTDWTQSLAESLTLTDGRSLGAARRLTEALSVADTRRLGATRALLDTLPLSDTRRLGAGRMLAEILSLTEAAELASILLLALTETLGLTETRALTAGKGLGEPLALWYGQFLTSGKGLAEAVGLTDGRNCGIGKGLGETLPLADSRLLGTGLGLSEPVMLADARRLALAKALAESLDLTDLLSALIGRELALALTERLPFSEQVRAALVLLETAACYGGSVQLALQLGGSVELAVQYGGVVNWLWAYGGSVETCGDG